VLARHRPLRVFVVWRAAVAHCADVEACAQRFRRGGLAFGGALSATARACRASAVTSRRDAASPRATVPTSNRRAAFEQSHRNQAAPWAYANKIAAAAICGCRILDSYAARRVHSTTAVRCERLSPPRACGHLCRAVTRRGMARWVRRRC